MLDLSNIIITPEILSLVSEIDEFKGAWQFHGRMAPERLKTLSLAAKMESIGASTRLDGAKLSDVDVMNVLVNENVSVLTTKDQRDGFMYARAYEWIIKQHQVFSFSENGIKQIYDCLVYNDVSSEENLKNEKNISNNGEDFEAPWKNLNISFTETKLFETIAPFEMSDELSELVKWTQTHLDQKRLHPLLLIGIFIALFLNIRPFHDLDGRLSRLLVLSLLLKAGYVYVSYSSLERIIEKNKEYYQLALERTTESLHSGISDFSIWLTFFLKIIQMQKRNLESKLSRDNKSREHLSALDNKILDAIGTYEKLSIMTIEQITGANRNTLKKHLAMLVEQSYIVRFGKARATWYVLS